METYRVAVGIVAAMDMMITSAGLGNFWWHMAPINWMNSYQVVVHLLIVEVLLLEFLAAISLFVTALGMISPARALKLCHIWEFFNSTWICLEMVMIFLIILHITILGEPALDSWILGKIVLFVQTEACLRLLGMHVVIKAMGKLKLRIFNNTGGDFQLRLLTAPASTQINA